MDMRIEVFMKIKKKNWGGGVGSRGEGVGILGVRVDVSGELKFSF